MHSHAFDYVAQALQYVDAPESVVEIGSRDVNGTVRPLFRSVRRYVGVDLVAGPAVDVVADGATVTLEQLSPGGRRVELVDALEDVPAGAEGELGPEFFDLGVCCEVFEHAPAWREILSNLARLVRPGGGVIGTCAMDPRLPHSAVDGLALRPGEFYRNIAPDEIAAAVQAAGLELVDLVARRDRGDLYFTARRPAP